MEAFFFMLVELRHAVLRLGLGLVGEGRDGKGGRCRVGFLMRLCGLWEYENENAK